MFKQKRQFRLACASTMVLALGVAAACGVDDGAGVSDDTIKIGAYAGLSGPAALTGRDMSRGWNLAFDEINAAGGINGRSIELTIEDDGYDPASAVAIVRNLVQNEGVLAVTGFGSGSTLAVRDYLASEGVPNLFPATGAPELYEPPAEWTFIAQPGYAADAYTSAEYGIEEGGVTRLAILALNNDAGDAVTEGCNAAANDHGIEVVGHHSFEASATDFSGQLNDLRARGADGVCVGGLVEQSGLLFTQAQQLNWSPQFMGFGIHSDPQLIEISAPGSVEGLMTVSALTPLSDQDPRMVEFVESYIAEYDTEPTGFALKGYWSAYLIADAIEAAGDQPTRESVRDAVINWDDYQESTGFSGPLTFSEDSPNGLHSLYPVEVRDGEFVPLTDGPQAVPEGF